jgi:hypothetical protein
VVHRIVKSTPFKAALGTGDKELYEFMSQHFDKVVYKDEDDDIIETGIQRAQTQIQEQFPHGFDYPPVEDEFMSLMTEIVNAIATDQAFINNDTPSEATQAVLKKFRDYFLPTEVTQGHHFNLNYLLEAIKLYNQKWNIWNENQLSLFWCQVIGYLERLVPGVDAQAFCQGLYSRPEKNQTPTRSLTLYNYQSSSDVDYFSSTFVTTATGLGFDFGICMVVGPGARGRWAGQPGDAPVDRLYVATLKNYVEQKPQSLTTFNNTLNSGLIRAPENTSTRCAIL